MKTKPKLKFDELNQLERDYFEPMQISTDDKTRRRELADLLVDAFLLFFSLYEVHRDFGRLEDKAYYQNLLAGNITDAVTKVTGIDSYMSNHIKELSEQVVDTTFKNEVKPVTPPQIHNQNQNKKPLKSSQSTIRDITPALLIDAGIGSLFPPYDSDPPSQPIEKNEETAKAIERALEREQELADEDDDLDTLEKDYWLSYRRAEDIAKSEANSFLNYTDYVDAKDRGATKKTWLTMLDDKVRNTHEEVEGQTIGIDETFTVGKSLMKFPHDLSNNPDPKEVINCRCAVMYS